MQLGRVLPHLCLFVAHALQPRLCPLLLRLHMQPFHWSVWVTWIVITLVLVVVLYVCETATADPSNRFTKGWAGFRDSAFNATFFSLNRCAAGGQLAGAAAANVASSLPSQQCAAHPAAAHPAAAHPATLCSKGPTLGELGSTPARVLSIFTIFFFMIL